MNKLLSIFVLFVLFFSTATLTFAESGSGDSSTGSDSGSGSDTTETIPDDSGSSGSGSSGSGSSEDNPIPVLYSEDNGSIDDISTDNSSIDDSPMDGSLDDEVELEDETEIEVEIESEDEFDNGNEIDNNSGPSNPCEKVIYVQNKLFKLNTELVEASDDGDLEKVRQIKSEIESQRRNFAMSRESCSRAEPTGVAVGLNCQIPEDLKASFEQVKEQYALAVNSKDFEAAKSLREQGARIDAQIREARLRCASTIVPGLMMLSNRTCNISQELYDKLERVQNRVSELEKIGSQIPTDLRRDSMDLENKIAASKARCNALKFNSNSSNSTQVRDYYTQRLSQTLEKEDTDAKIQELRELRREIDESIKNLIETKKKLRYEEVTGLVGEVRFKAKSTTIGDSETAEDVALEVEVEDSSVTIESGEDEVLLVEDGVEFTADDISVDTDGISVEGVPVTNLPSDIFENNEDLQSVSDNIYEMKLVVEENKAVYKAKYESKRKLFGFIGVTAKNEATIDAATTETISEDTPWWSGLSTEVATATEEGPVLT